MNAYFKCTVGKGGGSGSSELTVTCDSQFAGLTITCTDNTTVLTKTCPSTSPYEVKFDLPNGGIWTVKGTISGVEYSTEVNVDLNVELHVTPDGKTVTPVNDIQTWLHCADIWNKNYTTLDQVLADAGTLQALIASNNAADYMVRSTDWSGGGQGLVPIMTGYTKPSGEASSSGDWGSSYPSYAAFNGQTGGRYTTWTSANGTASSVKWIQYMSAEPMLVNKVTCRIGNYFGFSNSVTKFEVLGSNNGNTFTSLLTVNNPTFTANADVEFDIPNNNTWYKYIKVSFTGYTCHNAGQGVTYAVVVDELQFYAPERICSNQTAMVYIGNNDYCADALLANSVWRDAIYNSEYVESVLNVKVPTMTSNTTPSGEAIGVGKDSSYDYWYAFDNNNSSFCLLKAVGNYVGYDFTNAKVIRRIKFRSYDSVTWQNVSFIIKGSNNKTNWTEISSTLSANELNKDYYFNINTNNLAFRYVALFVVSGVVSAQFPIKGLQFYGR